MLYGDVLTDICAQLGDPDKVEYEERAKDHFARAISQLAIAGEFNEGDLHGYEKLSTTTDFSSQPVDISGLKALYIKNITPPLDTLMTADNRYSVEFITIDDARSIISNPDMQPADEEVYIYRIGDNLRYIQSSTSHWNTTTMSLWIFYVEDFDNSGWVDATDLEIYFRASFIRKCIAIAVQTIKQEDMMTQ